MKRLFLSLLTISLLFLLSAPSQALPKYDTTTLPIPANLLDSEKDLIKEVLQLQVYQDSKDPNQYYYIPPFHVRQYQEGAASAVTNPQILKNYAGIEAKKGEKESYSTNELNRLNQALAKIQNELSALELKCGEAIATGNEKLMVFWQKILDKKQLEYDLVFEELSDANSAYKSSGTLMSEGMCLEIDRQIVSYVEMSNIQVEFNESLPAWERKIQVKRAIASLANAYAGYLGVNTYAGFTKSQLEALRTYLRKYAPGVKVSLMPVEKITFGTMTNLAKDGSAASDGLKMFRNIIGSGDYLGASIILDMSVIAAMGIEEKLGPFILPVKIEAEFKQEQLPFEARLDCDFTTGYSIKGRGGVRDGLIIFDNDITNQIKSQDNSTGACNLIPIEGDMGSAEMAALKELEKIYEDIGLSRTQLSHAEKEKYYASVLSDIQNNRRPAKEYAPITGIFSLVGWAGTVIEGLSRAADFHWHSNIQDTENLSKIKFSKTIKSKGHKTVSKPVGVNICLIYNPDHHGYDRCTDSESLESQDMKTAIDQIASSDECAEYPNPSDCGARRIAAGKLPRKVKRGNPGDTTVVVAI